MKKKLAIDKIESDRDMETFSRLLTGETTYRTPMIIATQLKHFDSLEDKSVFANFPEDIKLLVHLRSSASPKWRNW